MKGPPAIPDLPCLPTSAEMEKVPVPIDFWRKFFRCASGDICHVIRMAIEVAAADSPAQLTLQRDRIVEMLRPPPPVVSPTRREGVPVSTAQKEEENSPPAEVLKIQESTKKIDYTDEEAVREKLRLSKRKLSESYKKTSCAKKQRTVKMIAINDAPKPSPDPARACRRLRF